MKYRLLTFCFSFLILASSSAIAQQMQWPKTFNTNGSIAKLYEPQPESYQGNILKIRSAVSLLRQGKTDPVFGVLWADVNVDNESNNIIWRSATVSNIKFPGEATDEELNLLTADLQKQVPHWNVTMPKANLTEKLQNSEKESKLSGTLNNTPPKIVYTQQPSILVLIDGQPQFRNNTSWGVDQVTNTPFTIIKNTDQRFYLYGDKTWFSATSIAGPWSPAGQLPSRLEKMDKQVRASDTAKAREVANTATNIIVSTEPAELIQSKGEANFSPIQGTNLLYMSNTFNDVFLDVNSQQYYALISGRWYRASNLNNSWTYTSADKLPADFAKIPEGSPKDVVLPNVAGTHAANESVMEAQVPQTAKVDRKNAKASVTYDGDPEFEQIEGTHLKYAVNTSGTVLSLGSKYYSVENGVWFESYRAMGPWSVATNRPAEVDNIPPSYPVYNSKYVYIYDATPDYVYMGYTPGYLGNYIYGPTIVYGTGYYYKPWRGRHYYPRASTWGYNMRYNPWSGWNFGIDYWGGWFNFGIGSYYQDNSWGGWWGPSIYYPAYYSPYNYNYGYYGRNVIVNNYTIINNCRTNNLYRDRSYVVTRDRPNFNNVNSNGRSTPYNYNNNGRFNNGRVMPGYNRGEDNGNMVQRPVPQPGDRQGQVNRPYQPNNNNNQPGRAGDRLGMTENNSNAAGRIGGPDMRPGNNTRIYTPVNNGSSNTGNDRNMNRPVHPAIDRTSNPITANPDQQSQINGNFNTSPSNSNTRMPVDRFDNNMQSRPPNQPSYSPAPRIERQDQPSPRMERQVQPSASPAPRMERQDQPSPRMERQVQPSASPAPRMERQDQPLPRMDRQVQPSASPSPRMERPSREGGSNNGDGGGGRSELGPQGRGNRQG